MKSGIGYWDVTMRPKCFEIDNVIDIRIGCNPCLTQPVRFKLITQYQIAAVSRIKNSIAPKRGFFDGAPMNMVQSELLLCGKSN
jgi:hypothetical protein